MGEVQSINPQLQKRIRNIVNRVRNSHDVEDAVRKAVADFSKKEGKRDPFGDPEGVVKNINDLDVNASTVILVKDIADKLVHHYPGWQWAVQPDERGQMVNIFCQNLHNMYGYRIRMVDIMNDPARREVIKGGGEILERFKQPTRMDPELLASAPRDLRGNCIPDLTGVASKQDKHRARIAKALADGSMQIMEGPDGKRYARMVTK